MHYYGRTLEVEKQNAPRPAKGAAFYKVPNQQAYYVIDEDGNIFDFGAAAPGGGTELLSFQVAIPSAQVLTLFDTPIEVIAAPGAGKIVEITSFTVYTDFNTTPYDTNTNVALKSENGANDDMITFVAQILGVTASGGASGLSQFGPTPRLLENEAVQVYALSGNPQNGDSDIIVSGTYRIVELS